MVIETRAGLDGANSKGLHIMHEKFREAWKAAGYVAAGLTADFPDQKLLVAYHFKDRIEERECTAREVGHVIERYCRKFPLATVYYHGVSAYGFVAQIRCHCGREKSRGCCRDGRHHRAKILVTLVPAEKDASAPVRES